MCSRAFQTFPSFQRSYSSRYGFMHFLEEKTFAAPECWLKKPKTHALYDACPDSREVHLKHYKNFNKHDSTCSHDLTQQNHPLFFSLLKDVISFSMHYLEFDPRGYKLLLFEPAACCHTRKEIPAEIHHITLLGSLTCYVFPKSYSINTLVSLQGSVDSLPQRANLTSSFLTDIQRWNLSGVESEKSALKKTPVWFIW